MKKIDYNTVKLNIPNRYVNNNLMHRFKKKCYEKDELELITQLDKNDKVLELGSCLGYLSVLTSRKVDTIVSVEANPELFDALNVTKSDNNCQNLEFVSTIVDEENTTKEMFTYDLIVAGSADRDDKENPDYNNKWSKNIKKYNVQTTSIKSLEQKYNVAFNTLLIDIEGGELLFFNQYKDYIQNNIKKIIVELHGRLMKDKEFDNKCLNILKECGFNVTLQKKGSYFLSKKI